MRGAANMDIDHCPLCLSKQASGKKTGDGFREMAVEVTPGISTVYRVTCPECDHEYDRTDDAIFFLEPCDGMRKRAVKDIRRWRFKGIPTITSKW
jgi:hypothetical protein